MSAKSNSGILPVSAVSMALLQSIAPAEVESMNNSRKLLPATSKQSECISFITTWTRFQNGWKFQAFPFVTCLMSLSFALRSKIRFLLATLLFAAPCFAADYVLVVDTSGSMVDPVSRTDSRTRIKVVQAALTDFFGRLHPDNRVYLISFNTGVTSEQEFYVRTDSDRQKIYHWIEALEQEASKRGGTHLCSTVRKALQVALSYSAEHPSEPVTVWALTDGGDNEPGQGTESGTPKRLNKVLAEFPSIDENSIKANLTILGDLALTMSSEKKWFRIRTDAKFENIVPPVTEWSPDHPKAEETITFLENSPSPYQFYDWRIDGKPSGYTKSIRMTFPTEGSHEVQLHVTTANGDKLSDTKHITIAPKTPLEKPKADFVIIPSAPEPGQQVELIAKPEGKIAKYVWSIDGVQVGTTDVINYSFPKEGKFEIKLNVVNTVGQEDEKRKSQAVEEKPLVVRFYADSEAQHGQNVRFVNETRGSEAITYEWEFGDGSKSTQKNPNHAFSATGSTIKEFSILLRAKTPMGKIFSSEPFFLKVWPKPPKPVASAQSSTNWARVGAAIQFVSQSTGLVERVLWKFGSEGSSSEPCPTFAFREPGTKKEVTLTVEGPGGSDSAKLYVTIVKPEPSILLKWIDPKGQDAVAPMVLNFRHGVPIAHAKSGQYEHPDFDTFEVTMPNDLPADGGLQINIGPKAHEALDVMRLVPNSQAITPISGLIREGGRFRINVLTNASAGDHSGFMLFKPEGSGIQLRVPNVNGTFGVTNSVEIPIKLVVGETGPGGIIFILLVCFVVGGVLLYRLWPTNRGFPPNQDVEVTLHELEAGKIDQRPAKHLQTGRFVLPAKYDNRISLGRCSGDAESKHLFDVDAPDAFLLRQTVGLVLKRSAMAKSEVIKNGKFSLMDKIKNQRNVRVLVKVLPKAGKPIEKALK